MYSYTKRSPNLLFGAGVLAGPFFVLVATIQDVTRPGFYPLRCQVSHLAIGATGWMQAINFLVTGTLVLAFAFGLRQALRPQKLLPVLLGLVGFGFITATFFATEPFYDCPSGPLSVPPGVTINGPVHDTAAGFIFTSFMVAGLLCGRRAFQQRQQVFAIYSILSVVAVLGFLTVSSLGYAQIGSAQTDLLDVGGLFERLALMSLFAWITTFAVSLLRGKHRKETRGK
jgi:hypothetical membrane protein